MKTFSPNFSVVFSSDKVLCYRDMSSKFANSMASVHTINATYLQTLVQVPPRKNRSNFLSWNFASWWTS